MPKKESKKKYGVKKIDKFNWCIYSIQKIKTGKKKGEKLEKVVGYYPNLETVLMGFIDFKIGKKLIGKDINEKKILKAIKKIKMEVLQEIKGVQ